MLSEKIDLVPSEDFDVKWNLTDHFASTQALDFSSASFWILLPPVFVVCKFKGDKVKYVTVFCKKNCTIHAQKNK